MKVHGQTALIECVDAKKIYLDFGQEIDFV